MAFLRRPCKNRPDGIEESSMKSIMWRYRDDAGRGKSHLPATSRGTRPYPGANHRFVSLPPLH
jgi:hypothetical protein